MISVALGELQCPSLDYVYDMTWAEFTLRLVSFNRVEKKKAVEHRNLCFYSGIDLDTKKVKSSKDLWEIKGVDKPKQTKPSKCQMAAYKKAMDEYLKIKKNV